MLSQGAYMCVLQTGVYLQYNLSYNLLLSLHQTNRQPLPMENVDNKALMKASHH